MFVTTMALELYLHSSLFAYYFEVTRYRRDVHQINLVRQIAFLKCKAQRFFFSDSLARRVCMRYNQALRVGVMLRQENHANF
jgi:hypothetical protein